MAGPARGRVLVVGGGVAGVAAAARLATADVSVVILEAGRRLGGRAASGILPPLGEVDLGFHVAMRTCSRFRRLLSLLGAEQSVRFQPRIEVPLWRAGRVHWVKSYPLFHLTPFLFQFGHLTVRERLALVRLLPGLAHVPEASAADWLRSLKIPSRAVDLLLRPLLLSALNGELEEVSARYAAMVIRRVLLSPRGGALGFFREPMSRVWERVVPLVGAAGGEVRTRARVAEISIERGRAVGVRLSSGEELEAEGVIAALPPWELAKLLPPDAEDWKEITWSPIVCVHLLFDRPVMVLPFFFSCEGPLQAVFSVTRLSNRGEGEHVALVQSAARDLVGLSDEAVLSRLLPRFKRIVPRAASGKLIASYVLRFPRATFVPTSEVERLRPGVRTGVEGLFVAGDFARTGWPATLEGAVRSGFSAADAWLGREGQAG